MVPPRPISRSSAWGPNTSRSIDIELDYGLSLDAKSTTTSGARRLRPITGLARPQPPERARRQQRVDEPVDRRLDRRRPGAVVPDRHLPERQRIADERGRADEAEHLQIIRARRQRTAGDV